MQLFIDNRSGYARLAECEDVVHSVLQETLLMMKIKHPVEISVSFVGDGEMAEINKKHRGVESATDVLSFPLCMPEEIEAHRSETPLPLGDIVISIDKVYAQAEAYGHAVTREIGFLAAHGMLHLLGYDHKTPETENMMFKKQETILNALGLTRHMHDDV